MVQWQKFSGVPLDDVVRGAIDRAALDVGNAAELARRAGVTVGLMSQWRSRNAARPVKVIPFPKWEKLYPFIREHLPADARYHPAAPGQPTPPTPPPAAAAVPPDDIADIADIVELLRAMPQESIERMRGAAQAEAIRVFLESRKAAS